MINDPIKMRKFETAAKKLGFHTERFHECYTGITIVFLGPHKIKKKNVLKQSRRMDVES